MNAECTESVGAYKHELYTVIQALGNEENLWLVRDSVSEKLLVMRKLPLFMQEVMQELALIDHPHIVHILDIFCFHKELYVIEEYVHGDNLAFYLEKKGALGKRAISAGKQILEALVVLQQHRILHRDIKPENIMMDRQGNVVLIDFGIARLFSEEKDRDTLLKGTKTYAPPEQFGFCQTDCRTDIYALGVTLNELAVGKLPEEKMCKGVLGKFIRRATRFDPKRRYPSAAQALAHLRWLKRQRMFLFSAVFALLFTGGFLCARICVRNFSHRVSVVNGLPQIYSSFDDYALLDSSPKRLLSSPLPAPLYPSIRLDNGECITFLEELSIEQEELSDTLEESPTEQEKLSDTQKTALDTQQILCTAEQTEEQFTLTCSCIPSSAQAEETRFTFNDSYYTIYGNASAQEGYIPEYELLCGDFDDDGQKEFLIVMARCKWYVPEVEEYAYYYTKYTCLWIIDLDENHQLVCSEPLLILDEHRPSLQNHFLISDDWMRFYSYKDGKWTGSYLDGEVYYLEHGEWYLLE